MARIFYAPIFTTINELFTFDFLFARNSFAGLVTYGTARLTSGLAGASAFATARNLLILGFSNRLNHNRAPIYKFIVSLL